MNYADLHAMGQEFWWKGFGEGLATGLLFGNLVVLAFILWMRRGR